MLFSRDGTKVMVEAVDSNQCTFLIVDANFKQVNDSQTELKSMIRTWRVEQDKNIAFTTLSNLKM